MSTRTEKIDHSVFPEIVTPDGEVISQEDVEYAYSREGRKEIGKEYPNPVPMMAPLGWRPEPPIWERIRSMVQNELSQVAAANEMETEAEANDFDVADDEMDPLSPWEDEFEPTQPWPARPDVVAAEEKIIAPEGSPAPANAVPAKVPPEGA